MAMSQWWWWPAADTDGGWQTTMIPSAPTAKIHVLKDVCYGKVRYIGALRTTHYALRPPYVSVLLLLWSDSARCRVEAVCARPR